MAKHSKRGFRALPIDKTLTAGTPAAGAVVKADMNSVVDSDFYCISIDCTWGKSNGTIGEGPIVVGIAHGDYSAAQIEEHLESIASWDSGDKLAQEKRRRQVRTVGIFPQSELDEVLNNGMRIKTKLGFVLQIGETLSVWVWNKSAAVLATGVLISVQGMLYGRKI